MNPGQMTPMQTKRGQLPFRRLAIVAVAAVSLLGGLALSLGAAKAGYVTAKSGQEILGDIDDSAADTVTITTADGKKIQLFKANVASIKYFDSVQEEFDWRMKKLGTQDVPGRLALARWAVTKNEKGFAEKAVTSARQIDPKSADVAAMEKQLGMNKPPPPPATVPAATKPVAAGPKIGPAIRTLTADEIQLVRMREMHPQGDKTVKLQVPPPTKVAARNAGVITAEEFKTITMPELGLRILNSPDAPPALKAQIKLMSDPVPLTEFRQKVNKPLVASCATAACHGGNLGGNMLLYPDPTKEEQALTNFVVFQKFEKTVDGTQRSMLDRTTPEASLLLAYMLPPELSRAPHPTVAGFKPAAPRGKTDPIYLATLHWMGQTLIPVAAQYTDIDLTAPAPPPANAPAPGSPLPAK